MRKKPANYSEALKITKAILEETNSFLGNLRAGWLHYLIGEYDNSIDYYSKASVMAPGAVTPLTGLSNCYIAKKDSANAIRITSAILSLDPTNYAANKRLSELYWNSEDYARASVYYLKLSTLYPEDLDIANSLAWSYLKLGRTYEAKIIFNNILIVNPVHSGAKAGLTALAPKAKRPELE